jgi:hypothetical protein
MIFDSKWPAENIRNKHLSKILTDVKVKLKFNFHLIWNNKINAVDRRKNHGNKLRTYRQFKQTHQKKTYLTKLRLSDHKLNIELLRYVPNRKPPTSGRLKMNYTF